MWKSVFAPAQSQQQIKMQHPPQLVRNFQPTQVTKVGQKIQQMAKFVSEIQINPVVENDMVNSFKREREAMREDFRKEKEEMREGFRRERDELRQEVKHEFDKQLANLKEESETAVAAILYGLKAIEDGAKKASVAMEAKFEAEFAKEMTRYMNSIQGDASPKSLKSFKDLGNLIRTKDKL